MKIYCISCSNSTNHKIVGEYKKKYTPNNTPGMEIEFAQGHWQILECLGCEEITFRETWINSEDRDSMTGEYDIFEKLYPERSDKVLPIKTFLNVPTTLKRIYREIIDCYNNEIYTMCAAGLRAIIEGLCADKKVKNGHVTVTNSDGSTKTVRKRNLMGKIEGLHEKGLLTRQHSEILHEHRFLGNDAVHDLKQPTQDELKLAIQIVEHTLENLYELKNKADEWRSKKNVSRK